MKYQFIYILLLMIMFSCKNEKQNNLATPETTDTIQSENIEISESDYGLWAGIFEADSVDYNRSEIFSVSNRIGFVIQKITDEDVKGYSVTAGNMRPFVGTIKNTDSTRYVVVTEPGDHKYDGTFKFNIAPNNDSIYGFWYSKRKDLPVYSRKFSLKRKDFRYDSNLMLKPNTFEYDEGEVENYPLVDWVNYKDKKENYEGEEYVINVNRAASDAIYKINASSKKLTEKELKNLRKLDLEIIRNTIFARHGYSFSNRGVRQYFDFVEWYIPLFTNVEDKLTSIENDNIALLKRLEKYAEDYYEQYGR
ncbi:YARHG domain-containing protein [Faecalibacter rhinopitheci]|uniref:YARHG domain-containing protein n=1 Tax=Faecalibacter rhinopitheci TaxID=2779678 RepID=A0A8J7KIQ8_9FLAO|nr:YARHG domain-containing protein [Faecalibacter rhinopitheci]MBF0598236.1 YARHG domain-containing protein [Faecalibacter rhinopitheci]